MKWLLSSLDKREDIGNYSIVTLRLKPQFEAEIEADEEKDETFKVIWPHSNSTHFLMLLTNFEKVDEETIYQTLEAKS